MNRSRRKQLIKEIECSVNKGGTLAEITVFVQDRPWTFVKVIYFLDGSLVVGYGFSKANWPDKWSPSYGRWLAIRRAASRIATRLEALEEEETIPVIDLASVAQQEREQGENWAGPIQGVVQVEHSIPMAAT